MTLSFDILSDAEGWTRTLASFPDYDFHQSFEFHAISHRNGEGDPVMVRALEGDTPVMAWPLLSRPIPGSEMKDLGSVYGYPGPLFAASVSQIEMLRKALEYLSGSGFVSVASRLHPVANAPLLSMAEAPEIRKIGDIVAADLSREQAELKREIRGAKNGTIKKIEKAGVTTRQSRNPRDTPIFQKIYQETMDRIAATPYYYFTDNYLNALLAADSFEASYVFAELDGTPIAAASIIDTPHYRQYYLSGTATAHSRLSPMSLILRDQIFDAKQAGKKWFILGGGLGGKEDSLTLFKRGFSKIMLPAGLICSVLDQDTYDQLSVGKNKDSGFFPAYRGS